MLFVLGNSVDCNDLLRLFLWFIIAVYLLFVVWRLFVLCLSVLWFAGWLYGGYCVYCYFGFLYCFDCVGLFDIYDFGDVTLLILFCFVDCCLVIYWCVCLCFVVELIVLLLFMITDVCCFRRLSDVYLFII